MVHEILEESLYLSKALLWRVQHMKNPAWEIKKQPAERSKRAYHSMFLHKMHVDEIVTQPGVTQTPKIVLNSYFFVVIRKIVFTCKIERLIESFIALV